LGGIWNYIKYGSYEIPLEYGIETDAEQLKHFCTNKPIMSVWDFRFPNTDIFDLLLYSNT